MSLPSTLPWKFSPLARSSSPASLTTSLPLIDFLADVQQADASGGPCARARHQHRAHHAELVAGARRAIDVGAEIEHIGVALDRRQHGGDRRPVDAGQGLQHEARDRHQRAGVARETAALPRPP
jgi:hypothetical protein